MKYTPTFITGLIISSTLLIPSATAQGVTGITLQSAPNAIGIEWGAPGAIAVDHYKVYYSKQSILENNGRFDSFEETIGNETSLILFDIKNRGFVHGDTIYITIAAVNASGQEAQELQEEANAKVQIPGTTLHRSASVGIENAVAQSATNVRVRFSGPITLSQTHPATLFTIQEDTTGILINILSVEQVGNDVTLTTAPMNARSRYSVTAAESLTGADGSAIDPAKRSAAFIARGETEPEAPIPTEAIPQQIEELPPSPVDIVISPVPTLISAPAPVINPVIPVVETVPELDTTPPEDVTKLSLRRELQADGNYTVHASWIASINSASDLSAYHIYESDNRGQTFVGPTALIATVTSTTIANIPPGTLTLKITTVDDKDNESFGIQEVIILPETGPALLLLLSGAGAGVATIRRKRHS